MFKMDIDKIWKDGEWTTQARKIINGLKNFPKDSKIILILRHSQRDEPHSYKKIHHLKLTQEGHSIAKEFGKALPNDRNIRLYHSVILRCQETAQDILSGFESIGGIGKMKGSFTPLWDLKTTPNFFPNLFKNATGYEFVYRWVAGLYPPDQIIPSQKYCEEAANLIWKELKGNSDNCIDIHVTHDLFIMALRLGWFGIPPDKNWVSFLGGFALTFEKNNILLLDSGNLGSVEIPYWWEN